ncbi:MAG: YdeI/OmpD-associated family protein [Nocardioidaceae bacterium]
MLAAERATLHFDGPAEFDAWLAEHQDSSPGIWMMFAKKGSTKTSVTHDEALEVALAYGWIDGQVRRHNDDFFLQGFSGRRAQSPWSMRNRRTAEALIAAGTMQPRGMAEVERARADGRWERAYEGQRKAEMPADFLEALEQTPAAKEFYESLNSHNRYAIFYRLQDAKRPQTRQRRIAKFVDMLARGEKFH